MKNLNAISWEDLHSQRETPCGLRKNGNCDCVKVQHFSFEEVGRLMVFPLVIAYSINNIYIITSRLGAHCWNSSRFIFCSNSTKPSSPSPPPCIQTHSLGTMPLSNVPSKKILPLSLHLIWSLNGWKSTCMRFADNHSGTCIFIIIVIIMNYYSYYCLLLFIHIHPFVAALQPPKFNPLLFTSWLADRHLMR